MTTRSSAAPSFRSASRVGVLAEIGRELREGRQARGEDLYDVADYLRIKPSYLFALEDGDHSPLPGSVYAMGFLRTYGEYLGLDGQRLVDRARSALQHGAGPQAGSPVPAAAAAAARKGRSGVGLVVASVALVAIVYAGWFSFLRREVPLAEQMGDLPTQVAGAAARVFDRADPPVKPTAEPTVQAAATAPARQPPLDATAAEAATPPARAEPPLRVPLPEPILELAPELRPTAIAVGDPAAASPAAGSAGQLLASLVDPARATAAGPGGLPSGRLAIVATESSWVQIRSADRSYLRTRMLEPGERMDLPDRTDLALWTGNAGGIRVLVDGAEFGPIGERGAVVKNVPIAADQLQRWARP